MNPAEKAVYQDSFTVSVKSLVSTYHYVILWHDTVHPKEHIRACGLVPALLLGRACWQKSFLIGRGVVLLRDMKLREIQGSGSKTFTVTERAGFGSWDIYNLMCYTGHSLHSPHSQWDLCKYVQTQFRITRVKADGSCKSGLPLCFQLACVMPLCKLGSPW